MIADEARKFGIAFRRSSGEQGHDEADCRRMVQGAGFAQAHPQTSSGRHTLHMLTEQGKGLLSRRAFGARA